MSLSNPAAASSPPDTSITIIEPPSRWAALNFGELWKYRELLVFFIFRDLKIRYKQTILGVAWAVLQPFITMIVFTFVFGRIARLPSDGVPYPLFSYVGLLPWTFFADGLNKGSTSLTSSANLIRKIYFPRLILPITATLSGIVDFMLAGAMLVLLYLYYAFDTPNLPAMIGAGAYPLENGGLALSAFRGASVHYEITGNIVWLPLLLGLAFVVALAVSLWLSVLNVRFRDVGYALGFVVRTLMYLTPVVYPLSQLDGPMRAIVALNPMTGVIEGFRWALLGVDTAPGPALLVSSAVAVLMLIGGLFYFRRAESHFADYL